MSVLDGCKRRLKNRLAVNAIHRVPAAKPHRMFHFPSNKRKKNSNVEVSVVEVALMSLLRFHVLSNYVIPISRLGGQSVRQS